MIDLHIRPERPADAASIAALLYAAFAGNPAENIQYMLEQISG